MKKLVTFLLCMSCILTQAQFSWGLVQTANNYIFPTGGVFTPDGTKLLVVSKRGKVFQSQFINGNLVRNTTPLIDKESETLSSGEQGMLDIVLDPNFGTENYIYIIHCLKRTSLGLEPKGFSGNESASILRVTQFEVDLNTNTILNENIIIGNELSNGIPILASNHVGASLNFDNTGALLITTGDSASGAYTLQAITDNILQPNINTPGVFRVQQIESLNGKVLRVNKSTGEGLFDNPFWTGNPQDVESKVWGIGLRNPAFATYFNNTLFISNTLGVLPQAIHVQFEGGVNHGYPFKEGFDNFQSGNVIYPQQNTTFSNLFLGTQSSYESSNDINIRRWTWKPSILDYGRTTSDLRTIEYSNGILEPLITSGFFSGISGAGIGYISSDIYGVEFQNTILFADFFSDNIAAVNFDSNTFQPFGPKIIPNPRNGITDIIEHPISKEIYVLHYGSGLYKLLYDNTLNIKEVDYSNEPFTSMFYNSAGQLIKGASTLENLPTGFYIEKRTYINNNNIQTIKRIN